MKRKLVTLLLALATAICLCLGLAACDSAKNGEHEHTYSQSWTSDDTYHWHAATCGHTAEVSNKSVHTFEDDVCVVCGYETAGHVHSIQKVAATSATCTEAGNTEYWRCTGCQKYFSDEGGATEITLAETVIPATNHSYGKVSYAWSSDFSTCTATRTCANDAGHVETETVKASFNVITAATCQQNGTGAYTATFKNGAFAQQRETATIPVADHSWGSWSVITAATCTEAGEEKHTCTVCNLTETSEIPVIGHNIQYHEAKPATCEETGYPAYEDCTRCDYSTYEEIPKADHSWTECSLAPTCTDYGFTDGKYCEVCGKTEVAEQNKIPPLYPGEGHMLQTGTIQLPACSDGKLQDVVFEYCERCGYSDFYDQVLKLGHDIHWTAGNEPTCTENGYYDYIWCPVCKFTTYEEFSALGHDTQSHEGLAATCTEKGWEAYETCSRCDYTTYHEISALGHDTHSHEGLAATCTEKGWEPYETCSRCDYTTYVELPSLGHAIQSHGAQAATCTEKGWEPYETCSRCDYTTYVELPSLGHDTQAHEGVAATCTEKGWEPYETCSRCDYTTYVELPSLGHAIQSHGAQAATCTEKGWNAYEACSRCDYTTYVELPSLGHAIQSHGAQAATCTEKGWNAYETCSRCDYSTYVELPSLGHAIQSHGAQAATCTEKGWNAYETCSRCDYTTYQEVSPLGHDTQSHGAQAATCTEKGWEPYETCSRCDYTTYVEISALGHDTQAHEGLAATCTEKGWNAYETCSRCDYTTYQEISALGHDTQAHEGLAATCTEKGWNAYETCSRCDYTTYQEISALGHAIQSHGAQAATCTEKGWEPYETCLRCDYTTYQEIAKIPHDAVTDSRKEATPSSTGLTEGSHCGVCGEIIVPQRTLYYLTLNVYNDEYGGVEEYTSSLAEGETVRLTATPGGGHGFAAWYRNSGLGERLSDQRIFDYTMPAENVTLLAVFSIYPNMDVWFGNAANSIANGNGTKDSPYQITYATELAYMAEVVNSGSKDYRDKYWSLEKSIDLNGNIWTPIGSYKTGGSDDFYGVFNGKNRTVYGLKIDSAIEGVTHYGFFGRARSSSVYDLNFENVQIDISGATDQTYYLGAAIGYIYGGSSTSEVTYGNLNVIRSDITMRDGKTVNVGGVIGCVKDLDNASLKVTYQGSVNVYFASHDANLGGLIGYGWSCDNLVLNGCEYSGNIYCNSQTASSVSGIVGYMDGCKNFELINCSHSGTIECIGTSNTFYVSGMLGYVNTLNGNATISQSHHTGLLSVESDGKVYVGGITVSSATVNRSYMQGNITVTTGEHPVRIGGIGADGSNVTDCYYVGDITLTGGDTSSYIGGIIGYGSSGKLVANAYAKGNITVNCTDDPYAGSMHIGGIIGSISTSDVAAQNCLSMMRISAANPNNSKFVLGNILTYNPKQIENCYYVYIGGLLVNGEIAAADDQDYALIVPSSDTGTLRFWQDTLGWDGAVWDFDNVHSAMPTLK